MTGIAVALRGSICSFDWRRVTVGDGSSLYGYSVVSGTFGALNNTSYNGATIKRIAVFDAMPNSSVFVFMAPQNLVQSFFTRIYLRNGTGVWAAYDTASATEYFADVDFGAGGHGTWWRWSHTPPADWLIGDVGSVKQVLIV